MSTIRDCLIPCLLVAALGCLPAAASAQGRNSNSPLSEVLATLDQLSQDIANLQTAVGTLQTDVTAIDTEVTNVKREVITCTLAQKQAGNCDRVRETKASACFELGVLGAKFGARWKGEMKAAAEGGAGWTSGPDGKIKIDVKMPVGPVPGDWGLEIAPKLAMKGQLCVEVPLEVLPATSFSSRGTMITTRATDDEAEFEALAARFEEISASIVPLVMERIDARMPSGDRLRSGVQAIDRLGDGDLMLLGGDFLSDPQLLDLADILPTPVMLRTAIQNPAALRSYLPSLEGTVQQRVTRLCDPQQGLSVMRSPLFADTSGQICSFLGTAPDFDSIAAQLLDIPEAVAGIVEGLIDDTQEVVKNATNAFCRRPLFANTRLCK